MSGARDTTLGIRMSAAEVRRATALAEHLGINVSNLVRLLLKEKSRALGLEPKAPDVA